jgi:hypothetical protein
LEGKVLSKIREVPQEAAVPRTPPAMALPAKMAPVIMKGAILTSGWEEKESSEFIKMKWIYNIDKKKLKERIEKGK